MKKGYKCILPAAFELISTSLAHLMPPILYMQLNMIVILGYVIDCSAITVGIVNRISLNVPIWSTRSTNLPILTGNCQECLCSIVTNSFSTTISSSSIGSFNCFTDNQTCQLFSSKTFYEFSLTNNANGTFYFFQIPKRN